MMIDLIKLFLKEHREHLKTTRISDKSLKEAKIELLDNILDKIDSTLITKAQREYEERIC